MPDKPSLQLTDINDLLDMDIAPPEVLMEPWLLSQSLSMVHAKRGIGKTYICLGVAVAIATGKSFLRWEAKEPKRVVYVDGEMPAHTIQERLRNLCNMVGVRPLPDMFRILTPDLLDRPMPDLSNSKGQRELTDILGEVDVVFLDNISTLFLGGEENEAQSWVPAQKLALLLRRSGIAVCFVHHSGKSGLQRGTSKREDILDTVIYLQHPSDYRAVEGLRVQCHYEKARNLYGEATNPFECKLEVRDNVAQWSTMNIGDRVLYEVVNMVIAGNSQREIAAELAISPATVSRKVKEARELGLLGADEIPPKDDDVQKGVFGS